MPRPRPEPRTVGERVRIAIAAVLIFLVGLVHGPLLQYVLFHR